MLNSNSYIFSLFITPPGACAVVIVSSEILICFGHPNSPKPTMMMKKMGSRFHFTLVYLFCLISICLSCPDLRFQKNGKFKILQVSDMHYVDGKLFCLDVLPSEKPYCSDHNTTAFLRRIINVEKPDLIVFSGDNIEGFSTFDSAKSMDLAFAPAIASNIPWVAILGNHDQQGNLDRKEVMRYIVGMKNTLSKFNPPGYVDGSGNYNLEVGGIQGSDFEHKSVLNLYFLDSGDVNPIPDEDYNYDWIKPTQQVWLNLTSSKLQEEYMNGSFPRRPRPAPGLVYFHIPLPEYAYFNSSNSLGEKLETGGPNGNGISSASVNSGFFTTMVETGDVKAAFVGHDHINDFCGELRGIHLCYAGGFGYHAYGKIGWPRRARVVLASLEKTKKGWGDVESIITWKRLDDRPFSRIDAEVLWKK